MKLSVFASILLLGLDTMYRFCSGISYLNREDCFLYSALPRWAFMVYEYLLELFLVVTVAVFAATFLEKYFMRVKRFIPKSPVGAFLYASVIPACSCSAVPMIRTMRGKIPFRTILTFVVAAPLLNPYIIMVSLTVLGFRYAILRILCSLILAVASGYIGEFFYRGMNHREIGMVDGCRIGGRCPIQKGDVYEETFAVLKRIVPFLLAAGLLGIGVELLAPSDVLKSFDLSNNVAGTLLVILIGVPVYFCNGADVLFLQPLIQHSSLPLGTAMAFSLTSTSVCITSIVLLVRFIGRRLTFVVLSCVVLGTLFLSVLLQFGSTLGL